MAITLSKATEVLRAYRESNYNASVALPKVGYKQSTATKQSKSIINKSIKKVAKDKLQSLVNSSNPLTLIESIGLTDDEVLGEYIKIIAQDKDLSTKLKALLPLLSQKGLKWNEEQTKVTIPTLNLTVETTEPTSQTKPMDSVEI